MMIQLSIAQAHPNITLRSCFIEVISYKQRDHRLLTKLPYTRNPPSTRITELFKENSTIPQFLILKSTLFFYTKSILPWLNETDYFAHPHHQNQSMESLHSINHRKICNHPCNLKEAWSASLGLHDQVYLICREETTYLLFGN